jgi:hypothetical protein
MTLRPRLRLLSLLPTRRPDRALLLGGAAAFAAAAVVLGSAAGAAGPQAVRGPVSWQAALTDHTPIPGQSLLHDVATIAQPDKRIYAPNSEIHMLAAVHAAAKIPHAAHSHAWVQRGPFGVKFIPGIANGGEKLADVDGMVTAIAIDPADKTGNTVFYGEHGGLFVSHNGGKTSRNVADGKFARTAVGAIAIDPNHPKNIYVGTGVSLYTISGDAVGTGVYVSHDGGKHFFRPAKNIRAYGVNAITVAGKSILVGTNAGLYRSTNKGHTFRRVKLPDGPGHHGQAHDPFGNWISTIVTRPGHPNEVTVGVGFAQGKFKDGLGHVLSPGNGLYRSTKHGAPGSFHYLSSTGDFAKRQNNPDITDDAVGRISLTYGLAKGQGSTMWALVSDAGKASGKSSADLPDFDPTGLGIDPGKTTELNGLYRSVNDGKSWTLQANSETLLASLNSTQAGLSALDYAPGVQSSYNNWVLTDPVDPNRVYVGLEEAFEGEYGAFNPANIGNPTNIPLTTKFQVMERYADICGFFTVVANGELGLVNGQGGGPSTPCPSQVPLYGGISTHPDQHAAAISKTKSGGIRMYSGNDGGLYVQDANTELDSVLGSGNITGFGNGEWRSANTVSTTEPYHSDFWSHGRLLVGLQDNGAAYVKKNGQGVEICGGDAIEVMPGPTPDSLFCTHGGETIDYVTGNGAHDFDYTPFNLITPFGLAPLSSDALNRKHLLAAGRDAEELTRFAAPSLSDGPTWVSVFDAGHSPVKRYPAAGSSCPGTGKRCNWQASATALHGNTAYVAYCGVCRNTLGNSAFVHAKVATNVRPGCHRKYGNPLCWHLAKSKGLPKRRISGIAFDPAHPKTVYVSLQDLTLIGYNHAVNGRARVMVSHDAGNTFHNISGNLPMANTWSVIVRNGKPIVASDVGVFTAPPNSPHWVRLGTGLPQVKVQDVRLNTSGRLLVASMYGRGAWVYNFHHRAKSGSTVTPPSHHQSGAVEGSHTPLSTTGLGSGLGVLGLMLVSAGLVVRRRMIRLPA